MVRSFSKLCKVHQRKFLFVYYTDSHKTHTKSITYTDIENTKEYGVTICLLPYGIASARQQQYTVINQKQSFSNLTRLKHTRLVVGIYQIGRLIGKAKNLEQQLLLLARNDPIHVDIVV